MVENIAKRNRKNEYRLVNLVIALTMIVWFVTGLLYTNVVEPGLVPVILGGSGLLTLVILGIAVYGMMKKVKPGREYEDERSDLCSFKATRNAFLVTLVALSLYMILGQLRPDSLYRIQALQGVFGVAVAAYAASYFYYKGAI